MIFRLAGIEELDKLIKYYEMVIDELETTDINLRWEKGVYPAKDFIKQAIEDKAMYVLYDGEEIAGSVVMNHDANPGYSKANWSIEAKDDKVAIIHALATSPKYRGQGIALKMLDQLKEISKNQNYEAIRFDVVQRNFRAHPLYLKAGFTHVGNLEFSYPSTGIEDFAMYEFNHIVKV